jgi:hypothetical protein
MLTAECNAGCRILFIVILNVVMLGVNMLSVVAPLQARQLGLGLFYLNIFVTYVYF